MTASRDRNKKPLSRFPDELRKAGFIIDRTCYPNVAYKGPRFSPKESRYCFTELEAKLFRALHEAAAHLDYCGYGDKWERECAKDSGLTKTVPDAVEFAEKFFQ